MINWKFIEDAAETIRCQGKEFLSDLQVQVLTADPMTREIVERLVELPGGLASFCTNGRDGRPLPMHEAEDVLRAGVKIHEYELERPLGKGTCGEVWRASAEGGIPVALKFIPWMRSEEAARREFRALDQVKGLRHAHLVSLHKFFVEGRWLVIVMDLADCSLRDFQESCCAAGSRGIPVPDLLQFCRETAEAVDFLNGRNVMHRDVKPDNIFLVGRHAKLGDCGQARAQELEWQQKASDAGTLLYKSPEALAGMPNGRSDQYSLAMSYVELRLGRLPFERPTVEESLQAIRNENPSLAPIQGEELRVLLKALAKNDADRYGSCQEFMRALEQAKPQDFPQSDGKAEVSRGQP